MHTYHLNKPRYVFDGKPPDMKSGEVICTCNTFMTHAVVAAPVCSACAYLFAYMFICYVASLRCN